jgi:hypothetical protein
MNSRQRISALRRRGHQLLKDWTETTEIDNFERWHPQLRTAADPLRLAA